MSARGPKPKTAANSPRLGGAKVIRHETLEPPSDLIEGARAEYDRLVGVLQAKGTLDRMDLAVIAECSRIKGLLDAMHKLAETDPDRLTICSIGMLTSQRRGLLRELGLTSQPSRSVVKTNPVAAEADPIASRIKLA